MLDADNTNIQNTIRKEIEPTSKYLANELFTILFMAHTLQWSSRVSITDYIEGVNNCIDIDSVPSLTQKCYDIQTSIINCTTTP